MKLPPDTGASISATARKLSDITKHYDAALKNSSLYENRLVDIPVPHLVFSSLTFPGCMNPTLKLEERSHQGKCSTCVVMCTDCGFERPFDMSRKVRRANENNVHLVYVMHQMGKGHAGAETLAEVKNMVAPPRQPAYDKLSSRLPAAAGEVTSKSMTDAVVELRRVVGSTECGVSADGTWQKRGS
ncbi:hypothetical protein HPB51_011272 [Rhipicephalus microplus]|uniref:Mutator-like transposase domain-containing protein n=1 Tax=Rhipicephalus microplus TaxID=6941 RepID=A0A9J6DME5_RHIMP|nr:hypothetical protein HPB51_011272 [Rhipicephalus microplus]